MKKVTWTFILLSPILFLTVTAAFNKDGSTFNTFKISTVFGSGGNFIQAFVDKPTPIGKYLGTFFSALFGTLPFGYVGKGTFIVHGKVLRILLFFGAIFVPFLPTVIALIGLWFKS